MIDWTTFPVRDGLTALALVVACLSLLISWNTARQAKAEKAVNGWITIERFHTEWFIATLNVKNGSHLGIEIQKLTVHPLEFKLGDLSQAKHIRDAAGLSTGLDLSSVEHCWAMPMKLTVAASETVESKLLLHQPAHGRCKRANIGVMYWTLEPKRKWRSIPVQVQTRSNF